jgi:hypothetical protein
LLFGQVPELETKVFDMNCAERACIIVLQKADQVDRYSLEIKFAAIDKNIDFQIFDRSFIIYNGLQLHPSFTDILYRKRDIYVGLYFAVSLYAQLMAKNCQYLSKYIRSFAFTRQCRFTFVHRTTVLFNESPSLYRLQLKVDGAEHQDAYGCTGGHGSILQFFNLKLEHANYVP